MKSAFLMGAGALAVSLIVGCREASTPAESDPQIHTLSFVLYSQARDARAQLQASGSRVSPITFDTSRGWIFTSSQAPESPSSGLVNASQTTATFDCTTDPDLGGKSGTTSCSLYSEAKRERDAMAADGHWVSEMRYNTTTGQWEFDWMLRPRPI
jgi:hypothetical protein